MQMQAVQPFLPPEEGIEYGEWLLSNVLKNVPHRLLYRYEYHKI